MREQAGLMTVACRFNVLELVQKMHPCIRGW